MCHFLFLSYSLREKGAYNTDAQSLQTSGVVVLIYFEKTFSYKLEVACYLLTLIKP
jgi:hypothetical protein